MRFLGFSIGPTSIPSYTESSVWYLGPTLPYRHRNHTDNIGTSHEISHTFPSTISAFIWELWMHHVDVECWRQCQLLYTDTDASYCALVVCRCSLACWTLDTAGCMNAWKLLSISPSPNQSLLASVPISVAIAGAAISVALVASLKAAYVSSHKARAWDLETSSHL